MKRNGSSGVALVLAAVLLGSCGYHVSGKADMMPKTLHTIAIPAWGNATVRYRLAERLPAALTREFVNRTRYDVVADPNDADAILTGSVVTFNAYPTIFDPVTGRAAAIQVLVILSVRLTERATGKILYDRQNFEARQQYEIAVDPEAYFEESGPAMERLSNEVARSVVSSVLEAF
ncbi:MAG: LptE family protein [Bryobacteraceae bacterium]